MAITGQDLRKLLNQNKTNKSTITGSDLRAAKKYGANSVNNDYISSYIKDTESYINNAKKQYEGVGWGNASEVYNTQSSTYDDLEKRRKTINSWLKLNQNKVANYDSLAKSLADLEKSTADVVGSFKSAKDYYSQWDTQEAYDAYKKTEDEKKAILEAPDFKEYSVKGEVMGKGYASGLNQLLGKAPKNTVANMRQDPKVLENYETAAKSSNGAAWGTTENIALNNIIYKAAKYMTDEEYGIYNYYFAKDEQDGTNLAEEYLSKIENALNYRQGSAEYEGIKDKPFLEMLFGVEAGLDQFVSGIGNLDNYFLGEEADLTSSTQYASGMVREDLGTFGKGLYDFTTTTSNMLPSILAGSMTNIIAPGAGTYVGAGLIGLSATGNAYAEMRNLGYNENQARGYATLVGASEATLSALFGGIKGIGGKLTNHAVSKFISGIDNGFARVAIKYGSEMLSEGLEESVQSVLEPMFKRLTTGDEFDVDWGEVAYSGLLGALSAGVLNAAPTTFEVAQTMAAGKNIKANEGVERLKKLGTSMSADSAAYKIANKIDENTGAYKIGLLLNEVGATLSEQNMSDIRTSLERKGVASKDAETIAKWMQKAVNGEYFTARQRAALENNDTLAQTLVDVVINPKSTIAQREGEFAALRELAQTKTTPTKAENSASTAEEAPEVTENAPIKEKASESKISASESNIKKPADTDNISEVIGKVGDKYKVRLNDGTELLEDAAEMSPNTERLFATAKDLGLNAESANAFLKSYDGSMSAADYATAYAEAYRYGEYNFAESEMRSDGFSALLSESQRKIAYESGRIDRKYKTEAKQAEIKKTDKKQNKGKLHNTFAPTNERQKASLKALGVLAEALGIDIYTFESETNAEGKHVGKNGWYDPKDNSIHIDVYAGAQGHDTILFTAAHELTHMIRRWSPAKFKVFADFLMEKYGEQGKSVSELVRAQISKAEKNGRKLTFDEAYEELVADSCESFLADGDAIAKIAELKAKDKSLWEKIKDYLTKLVARIKAAYEGLEPDSEEGKFVASLLDSAEELRDLWVEAVVDASTAYNEGEIVSIDETSESVSPAFSERTWTQSDYVVHRDEMAKKISEALGVTAAKAKSYIDDINSIAKMIADDRVRLDYEASSFGSAFVSNVEYGGSFDYTTLCKKRRIYTGTFTEIQKRLKDTALSPDDILKIRNLLIEEGIEATCGLCYVEGSRANMGKFAKEFIRLYKRDNPNGWIPNMADVNTPDGVEQMRISHPEVYEQYEYFWNHYGKLKDSDPALFASQQKPKLYEARKEYKGEIIENFSKDTSVAKKNRNGGIRMQSFSDFEIVHLIDTMQVIMDMSTVGLAGQAYTKVPEFALAFGDTGLKINLSLIAKGVDENGKLIFDDREGMPHKTAFDIREKYSKNVGTIIVAFTDEQILAAMADERIDFIIPFHRSQWKKGQYGAMGLPNGTKDYTYQQNEKFIKPTYHEYRGRMVRDKASNYMPNEYWDFSKSGKENAEHYLNMCAEENKRPKFYKFLDYDGNGRYSLKEDGSTDGYWKLLIDFKMYDNDGVGSPQTAVAPTFNMDEATKMLDEYKGGHANYPVAQGVVDKFVREYEGVKYSDRDSSYMDAVNRGDMETAQRMVDEAAKDWGAITNGNTRVPRPIHLYHGTGAFGFTRFHGGRIYTTAAESVATGYNRGRGLGRVRSSSLGYIPNDGTVDTAIKNAKNVLGAELTKLDDAKTQDIISKADNILKEVATKVAELDEVTDYGKAGEFFEYLTEKYGEDKAVQWTNNLDSLHYMLAAEYTAEEIVEDGEWLVHDLERYHEWKQSLSELWLEERDAIKESTLDKVFRYLLGYEYGDALIDIEFGLGRLLDNRQKLVNTNGSLVYLEDIIDSVEMAKDTGIYDLYGHPGEKPLVIDEGKRFWDAIPFENGFRSTDYIVKWAKERGYTSVLFKTVLDPSSGGSANIYADEWVFFDSNQVKSADTVTYDDNGNVIPLSQRFNAEDPDIRFSERDSDTVSNRTLLAEALEGITLNDIEKKKLADYKANAEKLDAAEARLKEVRTEIKDISFGKGTRDKARLSALKEEATQLTNRINIYDRRLINLEATSALKGVLDRAKADVKAREKAKAKADLDAYKERSKAREKEIADAYRESRAANVEGRRKTKLRGEIKGTLKRLTKLLKGGKERNVKEGMKDTVSIALALGEVLFNNEISNRDIVRLGVESVTEDESKLLNEYHDLLIKKDFNDERIKDIREGKIKPDSRPYLSECEEQNKKIEGRIATLNNKLSDVFTRERTRLNKTTVSTLISNLATEYHDLQNSKDEFIKMAYVPELFTRLIDLKKDMDGVAARDMTLAQLEEVYKTFSMIEHVVTNANKLWRDGKRESLEERRTAIFGEIGAIENAFDRDYAEWIGKTLGKINEWGWNNLRPVDAFELVGSESLTQLFWDVIDAQSVYARDIDEVKNAITSARQKYGYKKWDLSKTKPFEMPDGRTFNITLGEMMSIYAYSKREQADAHMREGGFQHAKGATYKDGKVVKLRKNEHLTYKIDDKLRFDIIRSLTKEQQAYVDDIQKLLTSWGEKGNEASRILYGIDLFNEEVYFPLKSSTDYLESMQTQLGQTATTASLAGSGMAKPTKPRANNPIILQAFDDVVLDHFDRMSKYHAYVVPIDNLRKILDSRGMDTNENMLSIKALIGEKLGDGAREYLLNYITDLNGSASVSGAKNPLENFFGKAKGASVAANLSVWVQQYFSIIRAFSEVNPRYFIPFINAQQTEGDLKAYGEMKKYAPIATIKEMGGFDVGSNRNIKDYVGYEEARVSKGKVAKNMTDAFGVGASLMDRLGWITIWKGIKKEVAASGKYKVGSEEYLKACGKRFEEVIVKTQVYDSVNARSGFMRSKHGAVKYLVSFMGEPTTIAGMAEVSVIKLKRALVSKDKETQKKATAKLVATMGSIAASSIATSLAKSLVYAMRDDDEEENYMEKYAEAFGQAFRDDITLLNYLPIARDIVSLFEGRTIERPDMTLIEDLIDSFRSLTENFADEDTTSEEWWSDGFKLAGAIANMFGIPAKNIWRDVSGLGRTISNSGNGYKTDVAKNFIEGFTGKEIKKGDDLYTAIVSGDTKRVKHYKSTYKTESAYNSAVRKALRENDPRIKEAAEARYKGRDSEYSRIAKQIVREGNFTQDDVVAAINAEVMAIKKSEAAKRTT